MSDETSKATLRRKNQFLFSERVFVGKGIDIGCGNNILNKKDFKKIKSVAPFDLKQGNAQFISSYIEENSYDFVHSSQCLEHMVDPVGALAEWIKILKPGGFLVATFPDEDLYEQEVFPSRWNPDHKFTFSIYKQESWSPRHFSVIDILLRMIHSIEIIKIEKIDTNYDYKLKDVDQTRGEAEAFIEIVLRKK